MAADLTASTRGYGTWKAPAEDGQTLIWPAPAGLLADARQNHRQLAKAEVGVQGVPLADMRRELRRWLGHADDSLPIIATGHQTELHHSGVWVKNVLIGAAADALGGRAMHFAVDTDAPKHLRLRWPGGSVPLTDAENPAAAWSGLLPCPSPSHLHDVTGSFDQAANEWRFQSLVPQFLTSMRRLALEQTTLPSALTNAIHELDWSLGLRHDALLVSPMCLAEPYLVFVYHLLARADQFAADYNAALDEFRRENKIRTVGRPMPNLKCLPEGCEVPFWLDDLATGTRTRAAVARGTGDFVLRLGSGEEFRFNPSAEGWSAAGELMLFLRRHGVRLSPRALTLTAVLRLLVADQFVHGIGGGQYDQVLDKLIARHFQLEPPRFSVTTATLFFPSAVGQSRVCMPCLEQEGHKLKHTLPDGDKARLVGAIAAAPRQSHERASLFSDLHAQLSAALSAEPFRQWERRFAEAQSQLANEKVLFDRELFYAIQPAERLAEMIARYRAAFLAV